MEGTATLAYRLNDWLCMKITGFADNNHELLLNVASTGTEGDDRLAIPTTWELQASQRNFCHRMTVISDNVYENELETHVNRLRGRHHQFGNITTFTMTIGGDDNPTVLHATALPGTGEAPPAPTLPTPCSGRNSAGTTEDCASPSTTWMDWGWKEWTTIQNQQCRRSHRTFRTRSA